MILVTRADLPDLITDMVGEIIKWSSNLPALENAIASSTDGESYALISNILRGLNQGGLSQKFAVDAGD